MQVIAHRGAAYDHRENTAAAVKAIPSWVKTVEIDTQLSRDGQIVAFHNMRTGNLLVNDCDCSWLYGHRGIQLVEDLINARPDLEFILDVKMRRTADRMRYARAAMHLPRRVSFYSHSLVMLLLLKEHADPIDLLKGSLEPEESIPRFIDGYMCGGKGWGKLPPEWVARMKDAGKKVYVFSGKTEDWMHDTIDRGVDAFLTCRFDRAENVLRERKLWTGK